MQACALLVHASVCTRPRLRARMRAAVHLDGAAAGTAAVLGACYPPLPWLSVTNARRPAALLGLKLGFRRKQIPVLRPGSHSGDFSAPAFLVRPACLSVHHMLHDPLGSKVAFLAERVKDLPHVLDADLMMARVE